MVSSEEARTPVLDETLGKTTEAPAEGSEAVEEGRVLPSEAAGKDSDGPSSVGDAVTSHPEGGEEEGPEKTLALADELFEKGSAAIEEEDYVQAVDCLSRALEIRVAHYGELAPECSLSYYKYGCGLLYKAQEEADPLGNVPKESPKSGTSASVTTVGNSGKASVNPEEEGPGEGDQETGDKGSDGDDEDLTEVDEDDSDLDLAWKMLDVARAIVERWNEDTLEKVNILSALGEVSLEREDFETSLSDYRKALSIVENLVESDHRRVVELNFRICLVLEVASKIDEALPYCEKAISSCKSRLQRLTKEVTKMKGLTAVESDACSLSSTSESATQLSGAPPSSPSLLEKEKEMEVIRGFESELEKKLEDMQQALSNPKSVLSEVLKMASATSVSGEKSVPFGEARSASLNSSQMGEVSGNFDSPTVSTAATNGTVTHLGVVGRGIKRASIAPMPVEPSPKRSSLDMPTEKSDSNASEVLDSTCQDIETPK